MKPVKIEGGFEFRQRGESIEITCLSHGCHHSTTAAAQDDLWARRFIAKHKKIHGGNA